MFLGIENELLMQWLNDYHALDLWEDELVELHLDRQLVGDEQWMLTEYGYPGGTWVHRRRSNQDGLSQLQQVRWLRER